MKQLLAVLLAILPATALAASGAASVNPTRLRCEYRIDPLGIDSPRPRLDWILQPTEPTARGLAQSGYHILAASSPELLAQDHGDLWDSGEVKSDQMNQLPYAGKPLSSNQQVWWKVSVLDQTGASSPWSAVATWTMGVLTPQDWAHAKWISAPDGATKPNLAGPKPKYETVVLRREFTVKPGLKRALINICGLGQYEMTLNGTKVGDDLLAPGWTLYNKTCLYDTRDITAALKPGSNAVGIFLGNGMYLLHKGRFSSNTNESLYFGPLQTIARLRLEYSDGTVDNIITDDHWRCASGPITYSSAYGGEDFDARLVQDGWDKPGFDESTWDKPAISDGPGGQLTGLSAAAPPIRPFEVFTPKDKIQLSPTTTVYDLGQNASIMLHLKVKGPAGSSVKITPSELVKNSGDINDTMSRGKAYWTYTLSGKGEESYFSHFFYRGGRYLKVEMIAAPGGTDLPSVQSIEGDAIRGDAPAAGQFSCSNELYNKIYTLIRWAQMNNMVSVMTDCPTREKRGWLEEDHLNGPALRYNFDLAAMMSKMVNDMADSQRANGLVTSTAPDFMRMSDDDVFNNPPEWGSACIIVPWQQYQFDGDLEPFRAHYETMKKYVAYLTDRATHNIVNFGLGDWYDNLGNGRAKLTPIALTATAFYYEDAHILAQIAPLIGRADDAAGYKQLAEQILASFNEKFFNAQANSYATGSQASNAVPLALDMVAPSARAAVLENLVQDFEAKQTTVGEVCLESLLNALADGGHSDLIYTMYNTQASGYGLQLKLGKTSLTEGWNGGDSQDHFMFGELSEWMFTHLLGIQRDPPAIAFKKIIIEPAIVGDLTSAKGSYDSIQGTILSEWKRSGSTLTMHIVIPPNTTATVYVPTKNATAVKEGGAPAVDAAGVKLLKRDEKTAVFAVGSGDYTFTATLP